MRKLDPSRLTADGKPDRRFGAKPRAPRVRSKELTPRERKVVELVATGATDDEIAKQLGIGRRAAAIVRMSATVRLGIAGTGARSAVMLTRHAIREGWVSL